MTEEIYAQALGLMNGACGNEQALRASCEAAYRELAGRLRRGVKPEDISALFEAAAAVLALALYTQLDDISGTVSFRAGDVSVSKRGGGAARDSAGALRNQAETMLLGYLADRGFQFKGVRG